MALTDAAIRKAKVKEKPYMIKDERGLYIEIRPSGRRFWRLRCWEDGKEKKKSLGEYPAVSLAQARQLRDDIKSSGPLAGGTVTFKDLAEEWLEKRKKPTCVPKYIRDLSYRMDTFLFPYIGGNDVRSISAPALLTVLRKIEAEGLHETAHRVHQLVGQVMRYGVATGRCDRDISADLRGALMPPQVTHRAAIIDPQGIRGLVRAVGDLSSVVVRHALLVGIYTFVRPGELRKMEWSEIDGDLWRIPAEKMKMRRSHLVPLSLQAVDSLERVRLFSGGGKYVFPSIRTSERPMSDGTVNAALRRMGYEKKEVTGHGFRAMASTILNENGWPPDVIERQLAHVEKNTVRAAYNHAEYLDKRREMMQWWADWLDGVRF
ncbi:tyrosine-type recombinase/integrase [Dethiosulfovibrio sp. F2B]|uniref:tyrosine-type recombinase/integrase n=1 Tax=Dethiosulfovibrio faecalis TaxID=2720018 RepID=UPI001F3E3E80|nr:tyrosine-type recombinase/integrase [Dethiosulfovibrio faecalis]MCF4151798.1 tyrosine-type recombinase/integrase [Dethiosulfovibrio faecalis]